VITAVAVVVGVVGVGCGVIAVVVVDADVGVGVVVGGGGGVGAAVVVVVVDGVLDGVVFGSVGGNAVVVGDSVSVLSVGAGAGVIVLVGDGNPEALRVGGACRAHKCLQRFGCAGGVGVIVGDALAVLEQLHSRIKSNSILKFQQGVCRAAHGGHQCNGR